MDFVCACVPIRLSILLAIYLLFMRQTSAVQVNVGLPEDFKLLTIWWVREGHTELLCDSNTKRHLGISHCKQGDDFTTGFDWPWKIVI